MTLSLVCIQFVFKMSFPAGLTGDAEKQKVGNQVFTLAIGLYGSD